MVRLVRSHDGRFGRKDFVEKISQDHTAYSGE